MLSSDANTHPLQRLTGISVDHKMRQLHASVKTRAVKRLRPYQVIGRTTRYAPRAGHRNHVPRHSRVPMQLNTKMGSQPRPTCAPPRVPLRTQQLSQRSVGPLAYLAILVLTIGIKESADTTKFVNYAILCSSECGNRTTLLAILTVFQSCVFHRTDTVCAEFAFSNTYQSLVVRNSTRSRRHPGQTADRP